MIDVNTPNFRSSGEIYFPNSNEVYYKVDKVVELILEICRKKHIILKKPAYGAQRVYFIKNNRFSGMFGKDNDQYFHARVEGVEKKNMTFKECVDWLLVNI